MERASITLIDKARTMCAPATDYQLAKRLGIKQQTISRCRMKGGTLDNEAATRLAELLGQEPYDVIAIMEVERAKDPKKRAFWESKLPRLVPVVAILGITAGVTNFTDGVVRQLDELYIMRSRIRRWLGLTAFGLGRYAPRTVYKGKSLSAILRPFTWQASPVLSVLQ